MEVTLSQYKAKNEAELVSVRAELERSGFVVESVENGLRCELKLGDVRTGYAFFVSAPFLFSLDRQPKYDPEDEIDREHRESGRRRFEIDLREFQNNLMYDTFSSTSERVECYLYVIGSEAYLNGEVDNFRRSFVEQDTSIARKSVVTMQRALVLLKNVFPVTRGSGAQAQPTFDAIPEVMYIKEDAKPVTVTCGLRQLDLDIDAQALTSSQYADVKVCMEGILLRILGPRYRVFWYSDGIQIGHEDSAVGTPLAFASTGERHAVAFAFFMARLAQTANADTRLGVYGVLNQFDVLRFLGAVDVLREFSYATGASVRFQSQKSDRRSLAERKFALIATVEKTTRYPYDT